jgi:hypothetical protein
LVLFLLRFTERVLVDLFVSAKLEANLPPTFFAPDLLLFGWFDVIVQTTLDYLKKNAPENGTFH